MLRKFLAAAQVAFLAAGSFAGLTAQAQSDSPGAMNLKFMTYAQAGYPEQDVFVLNASSTAVVRVPAADAKFHSNLDKPAYASASAQAHDLFMTGATPLGPFPTGNALGFTMNDWAAAKGSGTYSLTDNGTGTLTLSFEKLVPNGIYTIVCGRLTKPTATNAAALEEGTCIAADGSESALKADANGKANFRLEMKDLLAQSSADTSTIIELDYHSDGKTCDGHLCNLGQNSHIQLMAMLPTPHEMTKAECLASGLKTKNQTLRDARATYLTRLSDARKAYLAASAKARTEHNDAVKTANADRRAAEAQARADRQEALDDAKSDFSAATLSASNADDRAIAREAFDAAKDAAASNFDVAMDNAATNAHAALNKAQSDWNAAKDAAQAHWDADKDKAKLDWDAAKGAALAAWHASNQSCRKP